MCKIQIIVLCQYRENYGTEVNPHWKPKGGHHMLVEMDDSDMIMYYEDEIVKSIKEICRKKGNSGCSYEYLSHEVIFGGMENVTEQFDKEFKTTMSESVNG